MLLIIFGIHEDVINEHDHKIIQERSKDLFIRSIKVVGALVRPKGMITNS